MNRNCSIKVTFCGLFIGLLTQPVLGQHPSLPVDPRDFSIPSDVLVLGEYSMRTSGGYFAIQFKSLSDWLEKTDVFGEMVALNDDRDFDDACKTPVVRENKSDTDLRVCDVAYQMIAARKAERALLMKTLSTHAERDIMIKRMLETYPALSLWSRNSQGTTE